MIIINHTQRLPCFLAFVRNPLVSAVRYVDTIVTFLLSCHFSTVTGPKCLAMISPFSSFLSFTSLGTFFLCSFSVPTQSVECSILSFLANSGLLKKLSIHSICPRSNKGSKNYSTIAAVLGVSGAIRLDCRTILFLICLSEIFLPLLCLQYHSWVNSWTKCTDWNNAGWIPAITEHTLIATPNERLNYSLPI